MEELKIEKKKIVQILYTNWKGETRVRKIIPEKIWFGKTNWHPEDQWLLQALDVEKNAKRDFSLKDIKSWSEKNESKN